jgi:Uma2 family endonuclease
MGAAAVRLSKAEYSQLPESEKRGCELVHGELKKIGNAGFGHEWLKSRLNALIAVYLAGSRIGQLFADTQFALDQDNVRQPDLSIVLGNRFASVPDNEYPQGAPDVPIEIVSSETADQLEDKLSLYLRNGAQAVLVIYPRQRTVGVFYPSGDAHAFGEEQTVTLPGILPGFSFRTADIFSRS